jgi:hypothetical protein
MNKLIIGVGTGRCGTKSLTRLLEYQENTIAKHERYGSRVRWGSTPNLWPLRLWNDMKRENGISCEVGFYWTPHIETFISWGNKTDTDVRIVGLKRDKDETVESYDKWKPDSDHWSFHGYRETKPDDWDHCYPQFCTDSKIEGIKKFWEYTYRIIERCARDHEEVEVFNSFECFNTEEGVKSILEHCGFNDPNIEAGIKINSPDIDSTRNSIQW